MAGADRATAPAVVRAAKLLSLLAANQDPQRLTAIAGALSIPVSSTAAICSALEGERLIERRFGGFVLGPRNVELAQRYLAQLHPVAAFAEVVSGFTALRRETVQMALLDGSDMLYVARRDSDEPILISNAIGTRLPANCTAVGKASLAQLKLEERDLPDPLPALTKFSITDPGRLEAEFAQVASQGYAVDDEEASLGVMCLAVARRAARGEVYAITATMLKSRMTPEHERIIVHDLTAAADALFPPGLAAT